MTTARPLDNQSETAVGSTVTVMPGSSGDVVFVRPNASSPELLTVTVQPQLGNPSLSISALMGTVYFGGGGVNMQASFDLNQGVTFSVVASFLRVSVTNPALAPTANPPVTCAGFVGYGAQPYNSSPLRLTTGPLGPPPGIMGAGTSVTVPIPPFAVAFNVQSVTPATPGAGAAAIFVGPILLNQCDINGNAMTAHTVTSGDIASNQFEETIPLYGSPLTLVISNTSMDPAAVRIIWVLSL